VDRLAGQAEVRDRGRLNLVPLGNEVGARAGLAHLAPVLSGIVLVREPALCGRLNLEGVGLGPVGRF
jgi:hypothetical protein